MWSRKFSMLVDHEKNALGDGYIVEFIHDATENYYQVSSLCSWNLKVMLVLPSYASWFLLP